LAGKIKQTKQDQKKKNSNDLLHGMSAKLFLLKNLFVWFFNNLISLIITINFLELKKFSCSLV